MPRSTPPNAADLRVESRPIGAVTPYPGNPRRNDRAVPKVMASLREFGFRQPIVVDSQGVIIVGHTRYRAAVELGYTHVPVHVADSLTDAQVRAYRIADNRTAEEAEWDFATLATEMQALGLGTEELAALTAFDTFELEPLLAATWEPPAAEGTLGREEHSHGHSLTFTPEQWERVMAAAHEAGQDDDVAAFVVGMLP